MSDFATDAVVRVGKGGRGFIVHGARYQYVITAAHCLPRWRYPKPSLHNDIRELTLPKVLGSLGSKQCTVWAELCVLNLVDDVAVLSAPNDQLLDEPHEEYVRFTATGMMVGEAPAITPPYQWRDSPGAPAWVLGLDLRWMPCTVHNSGRLLMVRGPKIKSGMSGSPILNADGAAIGIVSTGSGDDHRGANLAGCLPAWLLRELQTAPCHRT